MKKIIVITLLSFSMMIASSFAEREGDMSEHMMGSPDYEEPSGPGAYPYGMMNPGMMGYGGYGMMGPGMMGPGMMGPGMMGYGGYGMMGPGMMNRMMGYGGYGMMGHGMMGPGMMNPGMMGYGGCGMMSPGMTGRGMMWQYGAKDYKKFLDDTKDLRKQLYDRKFEYFEAARKPDADRKKLAEIEKDMWEIQKKINEKWQK
jgi:hypothetical protein